MTRTDYPVGTTLDERVAELAQQQPDIAEAVEALNELWEEELGYRGRNVNFGDCERFAWRLCELVPGAEAYWGDELMTEEDHDGVNYSYHCFAKYGDRYYDSEHPEGVDDWRNLNCFLEMRGAW